MTFTNSPWQLVAVGLVATGAVAPLVAQEDASLPPPAASLMSETPRQPWRSLASMMAGVTFESDLEDATGFTFGVGYERRLRAWYGLGGFAQWTFGGPRSFVVGPAFTLHPTDPLRVTMAVPAEISTTSLTIFYRIELGYEFHLAERWVLAPSFAIDFGLGRRVLLFGASVGRPSGALVSKKS